MAAQPNGSQIREFIQNSAPSVSVISQIEVLGYHKLKDDERHLLESLFAVAVILPITSLIVGEAIRLRQIRRISLGDSLVAATALVHNLTLATHNTDDFSWISGLTLVDPIT